MLVTTARTTAPSSTRLKSRTSGEGQRTPPEAAVQGLNPPPTHTRGHRRDSVPPAQASVQGLQNRGSAAKHRAHSAADKTRDSLRDLLHIQSTLVTSAGTHDTSSQHVTMTEPPSVVRQAVKEFQALGPFELVPPRPKETSYIFKWRVRVEYIENGKGVFAWACLADEACRTSGKNLFKLYAGKTTMAVKHLQKIHNVGSPKTETATVKKRKHDHDYSHLSSSALYSNNPTRLNVLMTTLMIINHNLAFRMVEYEEARLIQALLYKDEMKAKITTKQVKEFIVELYYSTRKEITNYLQENREDYPNFTLVAEFWTCKTTQDKFLGLRVYLVDKAWEYKSILLGTRKFNLAYGDHAGGIVKPLKEWLKHMLEDFGLATSDLYGATSDSGGDVKSMLCKELNLHWEWCFAHMAYAATKSSCGVNGAASAAANPEMADLISWMVRTIFQVKVVSVTGSLFAELCKSKTKGASTRLDGYSTSRFLSMTRSLERVLENWSAITAWYEERARKALRANQPPPEFLLANRHDDLVHVLSVLKQIGEIKRTCQAEHPVQVDVLVQLYMARIHDLDPDQLLPHYLSTDNNPRWIPASDLTPLAADVRRLLREALDERFFSRYYNDKQFHKCQFVFEMQLKLHPIFKRTKRSLDRAVILSCRQHGKNGRDAVSRKNYVNAKIGCNLLDLLEAVSDPADV